MAGIAEQDGVDLQQRLADPETARALNRLLDHAGDLEKLLTLASLIEKSASALTAIAVDSFDEWAEKLKTEGIDLETSLRQGLRAALWLGTQVRQEELERLGFLLRSDVLNPHSVEAVGMAGTALASCHQGVCDQDVPQRVGMLGMLSALRDPNTQRAIAFGVQFAKCFGATLSERPETAVPQTQSSNGAAQ